MRVLNLVAFILGIYFLLASIAVHFFKKEYSFRDNTISEYAKGKYGFIMTLAFISIGLNQLIISWNFFITQSYLASIFIALSGIGVIIVSMYKIHKKKDKIYWTHWKGAAMQFIFFPLALIAYFFLYSGGYFTLLIGTLTFGFLFLIKFFDKRSRNGNIMYFGLVEKVNIILINSWLIIHPLTNI